MKTRFPQITGVELPRSGRGARQRMFSLVLQRKGSSFSVQTPVPDGPRQAGQFAAEAGKATNVLASSHTYSRGIVRISFIQFLDERFAILWREAGLRLHPTS